MIQRATLHLLVLVAAVLRRRATSGSGCSCGCYICLPQHTDDHCTYCATGLPEPAYEDDEDACAARPVTFGSRDEWALAGGS